MREPRVQYTDGGEIVYSELPVEMLQIIVSEC